MKEYIRKSFWEATDDQLLISEPHMGITTIVYPHSFDDGDYPEIFLTKERTGELILSDQGDILDRLFQTQGEITPYYREKLSEFAKEFGISYSKEKGFYLVTESKDLGISINIFGQALIRVDSEIMTKRPSPLKELKEQVYSILSTLIDTEIDDEFYFNWDEDELYPSDFHFRVHENKEAVIQCSSSSSRLDKISLFFKEYQEHKEQAHRIIILSNLDAQLRKAKSFQRAIIASDHIFPREVMKDKTTDLVERIMR